MRFPTILSSTRCALIAALGATLACGGGGGGASADGSGSTTVTLTETEPNDGVATANPVGALRPGTAFVIDGSIQEGAPDPFDVFEFMVAASARVEVMLAPANAATDVVLFVTDSAGALIEPAVQDGGDGEPEAITFEIDPTFYAEFNLTIAAFGPPSTYTLTVIGSPPTPAPASAPESARPSGLAEADWPALLATLRPASCTRPEQAGRPALRIDRARGRVEFGVLLKRASR